jgi:phytoene/squalene synthetase
MPSTSARSLPPRCSTCTADWTPSTTAAPGPLDADRALAHVVHRFAIPRLLLEALLEGFLWDAQGRRYETLETLQDYAARVAGTVGAMMALVMGARTPRALAGPASWALPCS